MNCIDCIQDCARRRARVDLLCNLAKDGLAGPQHLAVDKDGETRREIASLILEELVKTCFSFPCPRRKICPRPKDVNGAWLKTVHTILEPVFERAKGALMGECTEMSLKARGWQSFMVPGVSHLNLDSPNWR